MNAADIAAYIGAAAWAPQIAGWIHSYFVSPRLTIIPGADAEIGFTGFGPIFNLRMAITADRKDAIIDGFEIVLTHADGDSRRLRWSGLYETLSQVSNSTGERATVSRDDAPVALKIGTESLVEKFVRFQEPRYHATTRPLLTTLVTHFNFLKGSDPDYVAKALASKEFHDLIDARKAAFWWKAGRYEVEPHLSSPTKISVTGLSCFFDLTALDIEHLKRNVTVHETDMKNIIKSNLPDFEAEPINWNWANAVLHKSGSQALQPAG